MTIQEFFDKWNNKGCDFDGYYGFQCMDIAHQYAVDVVGKDIPPVPGAKDEWDKTIDGYEKIANSPTGIPQRGDIIIWGTGVGQYGHIAIFDHGDTNSFTSFDQNWPLNSLCHFQNHNYTGVLGWFHPTLQSQPDALQACLQQHAALVDACNKKDATINELNNKIDLLTTQLGRANVEISQSKADLLTCQSSLQSAQEKPVENPSTPPAPVQPTSPATQNPPEPSQTNYPRWVQTVLHFFFGS